MDGGGFLDQSLIALQVSKKFILYTILYSGAYFYIKKVYKVINNKNL